MSVGEEVGPVRQLHAGRLELPGRAHPVPVGETDPVAEASAVRAAREMVLPRSVHPVPVFRVAAHRTAAKERVAGGGVDEDLEPDPRLGLDAAHRRLPHAALGDHLGGARLLVEEGVLDIDDGAPHARVEDRVGMAVFQGHHQPGVGEDEVAHAGGVQRVGPRQEERDLGGRREGVERHPEDPAGGTGVPDRLDDRGVVHFELRPSPAPPCGAHIDGVRPVVEGGPHHLHGTAGCQQLGHRRHSSVRGSRLQGRRNLELYLRVSVL